MQHAHKCMAVHTAAWFALCFGTCVLPRCLSACGQRCVLSTVGLSAVSVSTANSEPGQSPWPKPGVQGKKQLREHRVLHAGLQTDSFGAEQESGTGTLGIAAALAHMCVLSQARECAAGRRLQLLLWGTVAFSGIHLFSPNG